MTNLSPHFTLEEFTASPTAKKLGLNNQPNTQELDRLTNTASKLEEVRTLLGGPLTINSAFRGQALNKAVKGVPNSAHCLGYAVDFTFKGKTPFQVCQAIAASGIVYDQLIHEYGSWTHLSFDPRGRRQSLSIFSAKQGYKSGILPVP